MRTGSRSDRWSATPAARAAYTNPDLRGETSIYPVGGFASLTRRLGRIPSIGPECKLIRVVPLWVCPLLTTQGPRYCRTRTVTKVYQVRNFLRIYYFIDYFKVIGHPFQRLKQPVARICFNLFAREVASCRVFAPVSKSST